MSACVGPPQAKSHSEPHEPHARMLFDRPTAGGGISGKRDCLSKLPRDAHSDSAKVDAMRSHPIGWSNESSGNETSSIPIQAPRSSQSFPGRLRNGSTGATSGHSTSHGSGQVSSSSGRGSSICSYGRERRYRLEIVALPRYCSTSGATLCTPALVVRLHVEQTPPVSAPGEDPGSEHGHQAGFLLAQDDVPYLVASVSVWSSDGQQQLMPLPATSSSDNALASTPVLMRGQLIVHGQLLADGNGQQHVYFVFSRIQLRQPGSWRFGVSLLGLWPDAIQESGGEAMQGVAPSTSSSGALLTTIIADQATLAIEEEDVDALAEASAAQLAEMQSIGLDTLFTAFRLQGVELAGSELSSEASD